MPEKTLIIIIFLSCVFLLVVLVLFIAGISHLYQKRQNQFLQELEQTKNRYERELLRSQLEIQEQTLRELSMDIHDNVGQTLSLAKLHLNTVDFSGAKQSKEKVHSAVDLLTRALDDIRDASKSWSLELIKVSGLEKAIDNQVTLLRKTDRFVIDYTVQGNYQHMDEQKEIFLFRIMQEAINNVIRHANAHCIQILLCYTSTATQLSISDDGKGFDTSTRSSGGISHMYARAKLIGAQLCIESQLEKGTNVSITIPSHHIN